LSTNEHRGFFVGLLVLAATRLRDRVTFAQQMTGFGDPFISE
jgi:hypothetical protein